jgi:hypothetical protein
MNKELNELRKAADKLYAEWERTHSQATMNQWLEVNDKIMAITREVLGLR